MLSKNVWLRRTGVAVTSILATYCFADIANAASDTIYKYSTPKTGSYVIDPMDMAADSSAGIDYFNDWTSGLHLNSGNSGCFNAGVHLPHGAKITQALMFYSSLAGKNKITLNLYRRTLSGNILSTIGNAFGTTQTGDPASVKVTLNESLTTVNNLANSYSVGACLNDTGNNIQGIRILYTYTTAGD
jgi:hypothetical protein